MNLQYVNTLLSYNDRVSAITVTLVINNEKDGDDFPANHPRRPAAGFREAGGGQVRASLASQRPAVTRWGLCY